MLALKCPCTPLKMSFSENATTVNLKSASLVIITRLHEGLTRSQSQIKPWLLFGESFTLRSVSVELSLLIKMSSLTYKKYIKRLYGF